MFFNTKCSNITVPIGQIKVIYIITTVVEDLKLFPDSIIGTQGLIFNITTWFVNMNHASYTTKYKHIWL